MSMETNNNAPQSPAQAHEAPTTVVSTQPNDAGEHELDARFQDEILAQAKADYEDVFNPQGRKGPPKPADPLKLPNGDRLLDPTVTGETPMTAQAEAAAQRVVEAQAPKTEENQAEEPAAEQPQTPQADTVKILGQEFKVSDLEQIIPAFMQYRQSHQQIEQANAKINQDFQKLKALHSSPETVILKKLTSDQAFRDRVMQIAEEIDTGVKHDVQSKAFDNEVTALKTELENLKQAIAQRDQAEQQRQQEFQNRQREQHFNDVTTKVDAVATKLAMELGLTDRHVDRVRAMAMQALQSQQIKFNEADLTNFFHRELRAESDYINSVRSGAKTEYLTAKKQNPVPPPTGGQPQNPQARMKAQKFGAELDDEVKGYLKTSGFFS